MKIKQTLYRTFFNTYKRIVVGKPTAEAVSAQPNEAEYEAARLNELYSYNILDTNPEKIFDDLTLLASEICQTPMAQISLIDKDRLWYKSNVGVTETELPREATFCTHMVNQKDLMIVADTLQDNRFANNPLVQLFPRIRFYAGAPLISASGFNLGSLCVLDKKPRLLTDSQQHALKILAEQTVSLLELQKLSIKLKQTNDALQEQITHREKAEIATRHASLHDHLTHLPNRRFLEQTLESFLSKGEDSKFALLFIDLDKFKTINDNHGHLVGDEILKIVASRLQSCIRQDDHISRLGGDEFVIVVNNHARIHVEAIANKIVEVIRSPIQLGDVTHTISTSVGVAYFPQDGNNFDALLHASDKALYAAKNAGKNQFVSK